MTQTSPEPERGRSLVVDTSAGVAVILGEPGSGDLAACLEHALVRLMPAAIRVELGIVIDTYALAERTGYPVLCTGNDFATTGISVLRPPAGNGEP